MKKWKINLVVKDEAEAAKILRTMANSFDIASNHNLPMNGIWIDVAGNQEMSLCEPVKE